MKKLEKDFYHELNKLKDIVMQQGLFGLTDKEAKIIYRGFKKILIELYKLQYPYQFNKHEEYKKEMFKY